jgi:D-alanyl-D-alanine carboxypeptidase
MKTKTAVATLLGLFVASAHAQPLDKAKLDQFLDRLAEKNKAMGGLTIAKDGNVVYSRFVGFSYINGADKRPATAATKYRIASITKTYTAVMIFQLIEEGRLKLTDTLDRFFPQIPNAPKIQVAHLLSHRSGIHDIDPDGVFGKQPRTKDEIIARIVSGTPDFEPDARFKYCNAGYVLLGYVVERLDGKPYADALKARITSRIGLKDTYAIATGTTDPDKNESRPYGYFGSWNEGAELDFSVPAGAGAIVATTADMAAFIHALFERKLVSQASLTQMTTMRDGEGMGLGTATFAGKTVIGYSGGSSSSGAWLAYFPEEKLALAYATNAKIYPVKDIVNGAFAIYWNQPFQIPTFEAVVVSPEILDRYVGVYTIPGSPARPTIKREGGTLYFQPGGGNAVPLEATAENKFKIDPAVFFEFDAAKGELKITRAGVERVFTKEK